MIYLALFMISLINMNEKNPNKKTSENKAEFIITVEWPYEADDDVDTYVEDPNGKLVFFRRREDGLMHLDRDDVGWRNDKIKTPNGFVEYKENREIVTIRGIVAGEYTVNAHLYSKYSELPTKVKVRLEKINPYSIVAVKEFELEAVGRERTAFRFRLNKDGEVVEINYLEKKLATSLVGDQGRYPAEDYPGYEGEEDYPEDYEWNEDYSEEPYLEEEEE